MATSGRNDTLNKLAQGIAERSSRVVGDGNYFEFATTRQEAFRAAGVSGWASPEWKEIPQPVTRNWVTIRHRLEAAN